MNLLSVYAASVALIFQGGALAPAARTAPVPAVAVWTGGPVLDSEKGRFHVEFPEGFSAPEEASKTIPTDVGKVEMTGFTCKSPTSLGMVAFADYPPEAIKSLPDLGKLLNTAQNGALKSMKAKLISKANISLDSFPGRTFRFWFKEGKLKVYGQFNLYIAGARLYQVVYITASKTDLDSAPTTAYFASFKITQ